ncbi:MAG: hypothetical protein HC927_12910 [Deltaproteobacteria bacterium]|nr:hypothetical protein [Deltaproteobacteria bacterium]
MRTRPLMLAGCLLAGCATGEGEKQTFVTTVTDEADESGTTDTTESETATESGESESESASDSTDAESSESETDETETETETGTPDCARRRYTFNLNNQTWSSIPLDADWTGPNAPSCETELLAVEYIEAWSRLIVLGADGMIYRRHEGEWQQPVSTEVILPAVAGKNVTAAIHTPSVEDPSVVTLFLVTDAGEAILYEVSENNSITLIDVVMTETRLRPAPRRRARTAPGPSRSPTSRCTPTPSGWSGGCTTATACSTRTTPRSCGSSGRRRTTPSSPARPMSRARPRSSAYANLGLGRAYFIAP